MLHVNLFFYSLLNSDEQSISKNFTFSNLYFNFQMDYINTSHPNFIGGSKALEMAVHQTKSSRVPLPSRPKVLCSVLCAHSDFFFPMLWMLIDSCCSLLFSNYNKILMLYIIGRDGIWQGISLWKKCKVSSTSFKGKWSSGWSDSGMCLVTKLAKI